MGLVVLHAPLSVWLSTSLPNVSELLIKGWKEILLVILLALTAVAVTQAKAWPTLLHDRLLQLGTAYTLLHLALLSWQPQGVLPALAGLAIDLRYVLLFGLVYIVAAHVPMARERLERIGVIGAAVVIIFGLLQLTILPRDVLSVIGYGDDTIQPYITIDDNEAFVRINSTLRGPNPLGAYLVIAITGAVAYLLTNKRYSVKMNKYVIGGGIVGGLIVLYASQSRSAWIGLLVAITVLFVILSRGSARIRQFSLALAAIGILAGAVGYIARDSYFFQHVVMHRDPTDSNNNNSNEGHLDSLTHSLNGAIEHPLGQGIGSSGSASLLGNQPRIIENQYLFLAAEAGLVGLGFFLAIQYQLLLRLWRGRDDWLLLGLFASGIGLGIIELIQPVWVDDTVSLVWWGLAGLVAKQRP